MPIKLDPKYHSRLELIRQHIRNLWKANPGPPWYTFHNDSHNEAVEKMIISLVPNNKFGSFSQEEWFFLLSAAWLHDVGMMLKFGAPDESIGSIRENHHERSAAYIRENKDALGLDELEADIIAEICRYHRKKLNILDCEETVGDIRLRLLSAYLRLADALHVDTTRSPDAMYQVLVAAGMPWESRIHWLKSFWIKSVIPDPENFRISINLINTDPESGRMEILANLVKNEIREELDSIRDVLIRGRISWFIDIETNVVKLSGGKPKIELDIVLSNLEQENLSSASEVVDSIVNTIIRLIDIGPKAYTSIKEYRKQLNNLLEVRSCHVLIRDLLTTIDGLILKEGSDTCEQILMQMRQELSLFKEKRKKNVSALAENAKPFLTDETSILLFGYSSLVIAALASLTPEIKAKTPIYVAEGRGKSQYNHKNEIVYCDGIRYAVSCKKAGFSEVFIIPDISVANLMKRKLIGKVVFGANGIDPTGDFGHTAGHLAIADLANKYKIPVYVIADTGKFGQFPWNQALERKHPWLTRDPKAIDELTKYDIKLLNPREDRVSRKCVNMLITERGVFPPTRIPDDLKNKPSSPKKPQSK